MRRAMARWPERLGCSVPASREDGAPPSQNQDCASVRTQTCCAGLAQMPWPAKASPTPSTSVQPCARAARAIDGVQPPTTWVCAHCASRASIVPGPRWMAQNAPPAPTVGSKYSETMIRRRAIREEISPSSRS